MTIFLPLRRGSERVKNKNTKNFAGEDFSLLHLKLQQLIPLVEEHEVIVSTNDDKVVDILSRFQNDFNFKLDIRPSNLCSSTTPLIDLIEYAGSIATQEEIMWTHVTSPFCSSKDYLRAINLFYEHQNTYDSLMSVNQLQEFIWEAKTSSILGNNSRSWPRTQDIKDLYVVNNAIFIAPRSIYLSLKDRIGVNPYLYLMDKIQGFDIDDQFDFQIAQLIYTSQV